MPVPAVVVVGKERFSLLCETGEVIVRRDEGETWAWRLGFMGFRAFLYERKREKNMQWQYKVMLC